MNNTWKAQAIRMQEEAEERANKLVQEHRQRALQAAEDRRQQHERMCRATAQSFGRR
jgi:hypothetical protein